MKLRTILRPGPHGCLQPSEQSFTRLNTELKRHQLAKPTRSPDLWVCYALDSHLRLQEDHGSCAG